MINCCFEVWLSETALISAGSLVTILAVLKSSVVLHTELWPTELTNIQHFARFFCRGMWGGESMMNSVSSLVKSYLFTKNVQPRPISLHAEEANGRENCAAVQVCCSSQDACPEEAVPWLFLRAVHHFFSHCLLALAWCFRSQTCTQASTAATNLCSCCCVHKQSLEKSPWLAPN